MASPPEAPDKQNATTTGSAHLSANAPRVLVLDASPERGPELAGWLTSEGFRVLLSSDEQEALALTRGRDLDLFIVDAHVPSVDWTGICSELRRAGETNLPMLLLTEPQDTNWEHIISGLALGETDSINDFLVRPFTSELLLAKVKTILRVSTLQHELRISNSMMKELTLYLDNMVEAKVAELENMNRLRRFFSPQIVEAIVSEDSDEILREHRGEITVVFLDLRNFTPFAETHDPQTVIQLVREFHETVGPVIFRYGGTLERFTGDGLMVFLGDPTPMADHPFEAVRMALHIQYMVRSKTEKWVELGYEDGLGIGVATGEAFLGTIGFERRYDYAAIGTVTNLAARLCSQAKAGQTLMSEKTHAKVHDRVYAKDCGAMRVKGFSKPGRVYAVEGLQTPLSLE